MAIDVDGDVGVFWNSERFAGAEVFADDVNLVASADGSIDVVLDTVVINVAIYCSL